MIYICTLLSFVFILTNNAIIISLLLLFLTIIIAIYRIRLTNSVWLSYILRLILAGALIILFIYMASLVPNKQIKLPSRVTWRRRFILCLIIMYPEGGVGYGISQVNNRNLFIITLAIVYLLIAVFVVTLIIKVNKGPLRSIK